MPVCCGKMKTVKKNLRKTQKNHTQFNFLKLESEKNSQLFQINIKIVWKIQKKLNNNKNNLDKIYLKEKKNSNCKKNKQLFYFSKIKINFTLKENRTK